MLQYEYKSVYFVCRKPRLSIGTVLSSTENDIHENGHHFLQTQDDKEEEENKEIVNGTTEFCSDNDDDHNTETN